MAKKHVIMYTALMVPLVYVLVAWFAFQWRNPKSNEMSFYRHFSQVVTFQKMEEYQ